jgi:Fe2+ or Zn2+ uptake regulation protein
MAEDPHTVVADRLHRARQRYTGGRRALMTALLGAGRPLTIAELLRDVDGDGAWSQSSLYRNLGVLESCGIVVRLPSSDGVARFEVTEELSRHHHHLVCSGCGRLDDVDLPDAARGDAAPPSPPRRARRSATRSTSIASSSSDAARSCR